MRQASLKLKNYASNVFAVDSNNLQKKILHTILLSFGALAVCYVLIITSTIFNIIERKALETKTRMVLNEVSELEVLYLSIGKDVDISMSRAMGFVETKTNFATRKSIGSLTLAQNEI
ncbi:hypothetical protein A2914_01610 [Candidatus Nomurabacteria bacterium RIFCSPLOWO2_01_FULL_41_21]|uniref:Cell division protein FtsL n=2 Tax=Candidatus Nomuraibacteriota TaxID=1752729 RepID=A0A1F6V1S0_9BACT|nr:MAG: hypothetical protein A2733_00495 [Candidatus Nomurabacteria bacterium RIFCSPHIGHO2_01_FULL_40_20]OGI88655.1 MAG: hypothetical protein A2914_01610 [Candidatus Nomurabacteria bacterium RIFCSPLOWO2_01_FULL_41_21]